MSHDLNSNFERKAADLIQKRNRKGRYHRLGFVDCKGSRHSSVSKVGVEAYVALVHVRDEGMDRVWDRDVCGCW